MERTPRHLADRGVQRTPLARGVAWLFAADSGPRNRFVARWFVLRCLGIIYFSAFLALVYQIRGLIGPEGILPARDLLHAIAQNAPSLRLAGRHARRQADRQDRHGHRHRRTAEGYDEP